MKIILYILLITSPIIGMAETATEGGYIVVRGAVKDCSEWQKRILDVVKIESQAPITLLEIPGFSVVGLSHNQLEDELSETIEKITGKSPDTLSVEVLSSDEEYQAIAKEYLMSLKMLVAGKCPYRKANDTEKNQKDELERIRLKNISKRIAVRNSLQPESWRHRTLLHNAV